MIQLQNIELAFGGQTIFDGLNWAIGIGRRIGLVGPNGAGKTTLLRVIAGSQDVDAGTVSLGGLDVGYLEQDLQVPQERVVRPATRRAPGRVLRIGEQVAPGVPLDLPALASPAPDFPRPPALTYPGGSFLAKYGIRTVGSS